MEKWSYRADLLTRESMRSVRDALDVLNGKWKIPIMLCLCQDSERFNEIKKDIPGITSKVLSKELKELQINKLITVTVCEVSQNVKYATTVHCSSLEKIIDGLKQWGDHHRALLFNRPCKTAIEA